MKIPIAKTNLKEKEINSILEPLKSGWLVQGPKVKKFEQKWSNFTKSKFSIAVTSCTSGLHLSLAALGIASEDEVIVPAFTWISTANVVEHVGAKVVFCDIDINTFNIDCTEIEKKITSKTKAIIPVHLFGLPANMKKINELAKKYNLFVLEDAACGFGAKFFNTHVGSLGDLGVFSFHPRKAITTGEGGMITTNSKQLTSKILKLRDHGASTSDLQRHLGNKPYLLSDHYEAGFNTRMTDLQAALGSAQMDRAKKITKERKEIGMKYNDAFKDLDWLITPIEQEGYEHGFQSYPCLFKPSNISLKNVELISKKRNKWMDFLLRKGISTRPSTHAVHMLNFYKEKYKHKPEDFLQSYIANNCSVSLPLYHGITEKEQDYVIKTVIKSL
mgnify:FL=1